MKENNNLENKNYKYMKKYLIIKNINLVLLIFFYSYS